MKWFTDLSTRKKLLMGFSVMLVFMAIIDVFAYIGIASVNQFQNKMMEVEFPLTMECVNIKNFTNRERLLTSRVIMIRRGPIMEQLNNDIRVVRAEINDVLQTITGLARGHQDYTSLVGKIIADRNEYVNEWDKQIYPLILNGKIIEAKKFYLQSHLQHFEDIRKATTELVDISTNRNKSFKIQSGRVMTKSIYIFAITGGIAIISGVAISLYLTRVIATPLRRISTVAEQISYGDLTGKISPTSRKDEIGALTLAIGMMTESNRTMTCEIQGAVKVIASLSNAMVECIERKDLGKEEIIAQIRERAGKLNELGQKLKELVEQYKV